MDNLSTAQLFRVVKKHPFGDRFSVGTYIRDVWSKKKELQVEYKSLPHTVAALVAALGMSAFAYTVSGTVTDTDGAAVVGADVKLVKENKAAKTDQSGAFSIHEDEATPADSMKVNPQDSTTAIRYLGQYNMIATAQVKVFDMTGHQVLNKYYTDASNLDMSKDLKSQGTYVAQVTIGSSTRMVKFNTNNKSINLATVPSVRGMLAKAAAAGEMLQVVAEGFDTLSIPLGTLDTTVALKLAKSAPKEKTYKFGYALGNNPRPSKGCGKDGVLKGTIQYQCNPENPQAGGTCNLDAQQFSIKVGNDNRTYYVTFPKNYDKNKPYKLLFANHCMGSSSNHFATWVNVNQDHPSPYYGQLELDKEGNYIFVAPQGDDSGMWTKGEADHKFIDALITHMEDNYCIDTSRVFATGFSFGAMFSNSLAQSFQHRLRAVAVYAVADYNIYLPENAGKPIAWMGVHGTNDNMCEYSRAKDSAVKRILKNNGKASDGDSQFTDASSESVPNYSGRGHDCYDFKNVDERFPVKFCTWGGPHQWTANDDGNWRNSWVPKMVKEFFEQF